MTLEDLLQKLVEPHEDPMPLLIGLVECLRPRRPNDFNAARQAIHALCFLLSENEAYRVGLRRAVMHLVMGRKQVSLYADTGIFPNNGFFTEVSHRFFRHAILPDIVDLNCLRDAVATVFHRSSDHIWVKGVGVDVWGELLHAMRFEARPGASIENATLRQMSEALRVLSYRVAAIGLDPEFLRLEPSLEQRSSPFMEQNVSMLAYLEQLEAASHAGGRYVAGHKAEAVLEAFDQCRAYGERIHARVAREGTSLSLTLQLRRLEQHIARSRSLMRVLSDAAACRNGSNGSDAIPGIAQLASELIEAVCRKDDVRDFIRQNVEILALRITENSGHSGEHYITAGRLDYLALLKSALGAGFIVAFMAAIKIPLSMAHWTPLDQAIGFGLNYGLGFMLIHILHGTVATKQPAMTAHAIAAVIDASSRTAHNLEALTTLIARTIRSQTAAIIGNIMLAVPVAMLIAMAYRTATGHHYIDQTKAMHLLHDANPTAQTLFYAAAAGICLFLAGQIAGYFDNVCAYNRIPQRVAGLKWAQRLLGKRRLQRVARYVEGNLGALAGNLFFGFMLAGVWAIGALFGLPLDIRHVTFSSAYIGFATAAQDFSVPPDVLLPAVIGTALIGLVNLLVSFTLAFAVALRSRHITFSQRAQLMRCVLRRLIRHPGEFLLPPMGAGMGKRKRASRRSTQHATLTEDA
ncbi:Site-specific recombinase [Burkholderia sp. YR290]|jgi:site-specific recombinase|nr:Site-specific recombinase [Paraburkholderia hospita]SOE65945.1 Site-specific recombinase [Burkholderia sp. YR290]